MWLLAAAVAAGALLVVGTIVIVIVVRAGRQNAVQNQNDSTGREEVLQNLNDLKSDSRETRSTALAWLADANPRDDMRGPVTAVLEPLLFDAQAPGESNTARSSTRTCTGPTTTTSRPCCASWTTRGIPGGTPGRPVR